jgi:solute carrier family 25 protein 38
MRQYDSNNIPIIHTENNKNNLHKQQHWQYSPLFRGAISGALSQALLQPLDVIKTLIQAESFSSYKSATKSLFENEGISGFYRGLVPTVIRGAIGPALFFQILEWLPIQRESSNMNALMAGALARGIATIIVAPITVLKTQQEWKNVNHYNSNNKIWWKNPQSLLRNGFVGLTPTLARDIPFSALHLMFYSAFKSRNNTSQPSVNNKQHHTNYHLDDLLSSFVAGVLATMITHPFDTLKTRLQTTGEISSLKPFSGLTLRVIKRPLSAAITWYLYELMGDD